MCRRTMIVLALTVLSSSALPGPAVAGIGPPIVAEPIATGLEAVTAFTIGQGGRFYYVERTTGEVRLFDPDDGSDSLIIDLPSPAQFAITLHPQYPAVPYIYVFGKRTSSTGVKDQLFRISTDGDVGVSFTSLLSVASGTDHHGARLLFGPDGKLWLTIGDEDRPADAQKVGSLAGKLLRMTAGGGVPAGNPFNGSRVYAYGLRNVFGFDFDPATGLVWMSENGPECNDEVLRTLKGRNYGWGPSATCATPPLPPRNTNLDGPNVVMPKWYWPGTIGPTGAAFCSGCGLGSEVEGELLLGDFNQGTIHALTLTTDRLRVTDESPLYDHPRGVLGLEVGADGSIYFNDFGAIYRLTTG